MRKFLSIFGLVVLLTAGLSLVATPAGAHDLKSHSANCTEVQGEFENFPGGTNSIKIYVDGSLFATDTFDGSSGSVSADWSAVTVDGESHNYHFTWTADGGGRAPEEGAFQFDAADCKPHDECPDIPDNQPKGTDCNPPKPPEKPPVKPKPPAPVPATPHFTG